MKRTRKRAGGASSKVSTWSVCQTLLLGDDKWAAHLDLGVLGAKEKRQSSQAEGALGKSGKDPPFKYRDQREMRDHSSHLLGMWARDGVTCPSDIFSFDPGSHAGWILL